MSNFDWRDTGLQGVEHAGWCGSCADFYEKYPGLVFLPRHGRFLCGDNEGTYRSRFQTECERQVEQKKRIFQGLPPLFDEEERSRMIERAVSGTLPANALNYWFQGRRSLTKEEFDDLLSNPHKRLAEEEKVLRRQALNFPHGRSSFARVYRGWKDGLPPWPSEESTEGEENLILREKATFIGNADNPDQNPLDASTYRGIIAFQNKRLKEVEREL